MADETILVVDADQETDQKITSALEAEGYLVFSGVSHVVTDEMAGKLNPSLIYIKPLSPNAAGFQPCREIHAIPKLQKVPIVLLAALKGKVQPQYTEYYGIVDFLKPNFTDEELIAKTVSVLASAQPPAEPEEELSRPIEVEESASFEEPLAVEEPMVLSKPPAEEKPAAAEDLITRNESPAAEEPPVWNEPPDKTPLSMNKPAAKQEGPSKRSAKTARAEEEFHWEEEEQKPAPAKQPMPSRTYRQRRVQKSSLLPWLIGLLVLVALGGGGFFAYQYFMPMQKPVVREVKKAAPPVAPAPQQDAANVQTTPPAAAPAPVPAPVTAAPATAPSPVPAPSAPAAPAKAPEQAPAKAQAPKKPTYAVQVGAFKTEDIASSLVKKLKGKGYEAYSQKGVTKDKAPIIRVLIGNFSDRKAAMKLASEVQSKEQIKTTIFTD